MTICLDCRDGIHAACTICVCCSPFLRRVTDRAERQRAADTAGRGERTVALHADLAADVAYYAKGTTDER